MIGLDDFHNYSVGYFLEYFQLHPDSLPNDPKDKMGSDLRAAQKLAFRLYQYVSKSPPPRGLVWELAGRKIQR